MKPAISQKILSLLAAVVIVPSAAHQKFHLFAQSTAKMSAPSSTQMLLAGTWTLEICDNILPDGTRVELYGPHPKGMVIYDGFGHYSMQIMSASRPRFAANDKSRGTPEEYAAAIKGTNAHYGTYTVDEANRTIISHVEGATFANWEGTDRKSPFTLEGDTLTYKVLSPTTGGNATGEVRWRRVRP
jgi:hypothetical protein